MNIRIIAGKFGGRQIKAPDGRTTHPMSDRVRGSLFNIINADLPGAGVLDIFAGTGSLGLEALSRGANSAAFVERDRFASKILEENILSLGVGSVAKAYRMGAATWVDKNIAQFDIIFADPPYHDMQLSLIGRLGGLLKPNGILILSYPERMELPVIDGTELADTRDYGTANLAFYKRA